MTTLPAAQVTEEEPAIREETDHPALNQEEATPLIEEAPVYEEPEAETTDQARSARLAVKNRRYETGRSLLDDQKDSPAKPDRRNLLEIYRQQPAAKANPGGSDKPDTPVAEKAGNGTLIFFLLLGGAIILAWRRSLPRNARINFIRL